MHFARPEFLFLLLLIPLTVIFLVKTFRKRRNAINQFGNISLIRDDSLLPGAKRHVIKTILCTLSLIFIIISLARPQSGATEERVKRDSIEIVFTIDTSLSMLANDVKPNRLMAAKNEVYNLLNTLRGERVGIVAFSGSALALCPPTVDYTVTRYFLDMLNSDTVITLGSSLGDAVVAASRLFEESSRVKAIVFLSDGEDHETSLTTLGKIAKKAKENGIRIFALGMGTTTGSLIPVFDEKSKAIVYKRDRRGELVHSKLKELTLQRLCSITKGTYYNFSPTAVEQSNAMKKNGLNRIYTEILDISKKITETEQPQKTAMVYKDISQYSIALALIFLFINILISECKGTPRLWLRHTGKARVGLISGNRLTPRSLIIPLILSAFLGLGWDPWNPAAERVQEGNRLFNEKRYQDALLKYKEARQYEPHQTVINFNIGNIYYLMQSYNKAIAEFNVAINSEDKTLRANALFNRGNTEFRLGSLQEAAQSYKKVLQLNPFDQEAKYNLEFVKRELSKIRKTQKKKPTLPEEKEEMIEEGKPGIEKEKQPPVGLTDKRKPTGKAPSDNKKEKKLKKEPEAITPEQALDFLKEHKQREQEEQKISGWFRLRMKHLEKDW